jgi:hypothetical protein
MRILRCSQNTGHLNGLPSVWISNSLCRPSNKETMMAAAVREPFEKKTVLYRMVLP